MKSPFPNVTINSVNKKIYSIDLTGGGAEPAILKISFICSLGESDSYNLNTSDPIDVRIGNFYTFRGYIIASSERQSVSSGTTCELTLIDSSVILDKLWVGLKGKHGGPPAPLLKNSISTVVPNTNILSSFTTRGTFPNNLILVGNAVDPCQNFESETPRDPCDPCSSSENTSPFDCSKSRALDILEVDYTFNDLIKAATFKNISFNQTFSTSNSYRADYTGSLREVLNNWCRDYGYSFYWDASTSSVVFIDLRYGITIADNHDFGFCKVEEKSTTRSIENVTKNLSIAYFGSNGDIKDYQCSQASSNNSNTALPITLTPVSLERLAERNTPLLALYETEDNFKMAIACKKISNNLRDAFVWNKILGYNNPGQVKTGKHRLMDFNIRAICYPLTTIGQVTEGFDVTAVRSWYNAILTNSGFGFSQEEAIKIRDSQSYFIIVENIDPFLEKFETTALTSFCGRYGAAAKNRTDDNVSAPDGNIRTVESTVSEDRGAGNGFFTFILPDIEITHPLIKDGNVGIIEASEATVTEQQEGLDRRTVVQVAEGKRYIILERAPSWIIQEAPSLSPILVKLDAAIVKSSFGINSDFSIYLVPTFGTPSSAYLSVSLTSIGHPNEKNSQFGILAEATDKVSIEYKPLGANRSSTSLSVIMPTAASYRARKSRQRSSFNGEVNIRIIVPKYEVVIANSDNTPSNTDEFVAFNVSPIDISDNDLSKYVRTNGRCKIEDSKVFTYADAIMGNLVENQRKFKKTISYSILGLPNVTYTPVQGLTSFSIRLDQSGTRTSVTFSDIPPVPISDNLKKNQIKYLIKTQNKKPTINKIV
jgi:hypothetical protein